MASHTKNLQRKAVEHQEEPKSAFRVKAFWANMARPSDEEEEAKDRCHFGPNDLHG